MADRPPPRTIRALVVRSFEGEPTVEAVAGPAAPGPGEVLVEVRAAGINRVDLKVHAGQLRHYADHRFPLVLGVDASGTVRAVGAGVTGLDPGDEVYGTSGKPHYGEGTFAEWCTMRAGSVARRPRRLTDAQAAAVPTPALTASTLVDAGAPRRGDTVLVIGAAGAVGAFATQLLRLRGVRVVALARREQEGHLRRLGASAVSDHRDAGWGAEVGRWAPLDGVVDLAGHHEQLVRLLPLLRPGGWLLSAVLAARIEELPPGEVRAEWVEVDRSRARLEALADLFDRGALLVPPVSSRPLAQGPAALAAARTARAPRRVVIVMAPAPR